MKRGRQWSLSVWYRSHCWLGHTDRWVGDGLEGHGQVYSLDGYGQALPGVRASGLEGYGQMVMGRQVIGVREGSLGGYG